MSNFLEGVQVIHFLGDGTPIPKADKDEDEDESEGTTITSADGKVVIHKHHGDGPSTIIPVVAIFFGFAYLIIRTVMAPFHNRNKTAASTSSGGLSEQEVAILHKLERTLSQMESRVEALETILIDQNRTAKNYGSKF